MLTQQFKRNQSEKISTAQAKDRLNNVFGGDTLESTVKQFHVDGRRAVVQVMEDLTEQFPEVARRIKGIVPTMKGSKSSLAAAMPPGNITGQMSGRNGSFIFKAPFRKKQDLGSSIQPRMKRYHDGSASQGLESWEEVNVSFWSKGAGADPLSHIVAHEFGHQVHGLAEDIMHIQTSGSLETGRKINSRLLLDKKVREALDDANLSSSDLDIAKNVSHYATTNSAETFAESFSEVYNLGPDARPYARTIVDAVVKVIDDYKGVHP